MEIVKVCGMRQPEQIKALDQSKMANWMGFIFYPGSKRYVPGNLATTENVERVGVFVDAIMLELRLLAVRHKLTILQLHGSESPAYCSALKSNYRVIKAFGIDETFDFNRLREYEPAVDYFLFDTRTEQHGGSGRLFNWEVLQQYTGTTPFLLSGGISEDQLERLREFRHPAFLGIDLNSGFENNPGDKNLDKLQTFIKALKQ